MLPNVSDRSGKHNIATIVDTMIRNILHLLQKQSAAVEFEFFSFLMPEIDIVLGVRNDSQGK
jgi:hypothetical protein